VHKRYYILYQTILHSTSITPENKNNIIPIINNIKNTLGLPVKNDPNQSKFSEAIEKAITFFTSKTQK